jgi:hypothetical protein
LVALYVLGAVLFVGNIITAAFWKLLAEREGNPQVIASAAKRVMLADYWFTIPGIMLLLTTRHVLMAQAGYSLLRLSWILGQIKPGNLSQRGRYHDSDRTLYCTASRTHRRVSNRDAGQQLVKV